MADEEFMFGDLFATVRVQDLPASREVVAVERQENGTWRVCGSAIANTDGIAELGIEGLKTSRVYAFAIDHWGEPFTPNKTVAYGDIIRPSVFLGWLYRVTTPGVLPGEEPVWWNSTPGMPRPVGSAMAQAEMYFQPIAHGPVDIEWEEKGEGDPHWDKVVSLLHFDGDLKDETGREWTQTGEFLTSADNKVFGTESAYFPPTGLRGLQTPSTLDLNIGSNDFTVECWINPRIRSRQLNICGLYGWTYERRSWDFLFQDGALKFRISPDGSWHATYVAEATMGPDMLNRWTHIAVTREGNVFRMFFDGVVVSQATHNISAFGNLTDPFVFGTAGPDFINSWDGYIDELRITKGVARYTENFTPPTEPFPNFK